MTQTREDQRVAPPPVRPRAGGAWWRVLSVSLGFLALYWLLAHVAKHTLGVVGNDPAALPLLVGHIDTWQPAVGAILGLLLIFGLRYTPVVLLAGLLTAAALATPEHRPAALGVALINTAGYALAALVLRAWLRCDVRLGRLRDVISLLGVTLLAPLLVSGANVALLTALHIYAPESAADNLRNWWVADVVGILTVTPFIMAFLAGWGRAPAPADRAEGEILPETADAHRHPVWVGVLELLAWLAAIGLVLFVTLYPPIRAEYNLIYLFFLLLVWVSLRHGMHGTTVAVLTIALGITVPVVVFGLTPPPAAETQVFLLTLALTGLLAGAVVSERQRSVDAMRENEQLLRTLINAMPDRVTFEDGAGRWLLANDYGLRLFGLDGVPYHGQTAAELAAHAPATAQALRDAATAEAGAWQAGVPVRAEETILAADGTPRVFDSITVPLFHADGRRKGLVVIGRDITARKQMEEEIQTERAYLTSAIDILPLPLAFVTLDGELTQANLALTTLYTRLPEHLGDGAALLAPDTRAVIPWELSPLARACRGEMPQPIEALLSLPDGRGVPVLFYAAPIRVGGKLVAAVAALQDVSALKEADRAKDEFLGILSHELLTPLNDILGWTQAANESDELIPQALEIIAHNVKLLQRVLIDLLDLSRIIHGKLYLTKDACDLWELVTEGVQEFEPSARERRRTVILQEPDGDLPVQLDRGRMRQAIGILLANALKNTDPGDTITLGGGAEGADVTLVLRDTGRGIPPDALATYFQPFQRGQALEPGRGLEMALVKGIVEMHGGTVTVASAGADQGSTFTLTLPLSRGRVELE